MVEPMHIGLFIIVAASLYFLLTSRIRVDSRYLMNVSYHRGGSIPFQNSKNTSRWETPAPRPVMIRNIKKGSPPMTYYGHGIPLVDVEPGPIIDPFKIAHNTGLAVLPECCPSPYSSSNGCLCGAIEEVSELATGRKHRDAPLGNVY
jgi:hypothetical protein